MAHFGTVYFATAFSDLDFSSNVLLQLGLLLALFNEGRSYVLTRNLAGSSLWDRIDYPHLHWHLELERLNEYKESAQTEQVYFTFVISVLPWKAFC